VPDNEFPVLKDKAAIITGAAMGMGAATARLFAEAGARVLVADMNEEHGRAVVKEIEADGGTAVFQQLVKQGGGGSIVNISSGSGFRPQPDTPIYNAAKHGVNGLSKTAAIENGVHNIRVNVVAPGVIDTPMLREAMERSGLTEEGFVGPVDLLGRFGQPREVAQASLWLASDQASYVTGAVIHVDGGATSRWSCRVAGAPPRGTSQTTPPAGRTSGDPTTEDEGSTIPRSA
jgi:NAD(P)-dependent dehydrogenase (short-subunit alcohol dehydrogenase family)